jgi:acyl-CoA reductase-like NAD-dependent aldehyde dehydrogenase
LICADTIYIAILARLLMGLGSAFAFVSVLVVTADLFPASYFATLAEEIDTKQYENIENGSGGDFTTKIIHEPIGVIGAITPWNFPFMMGIWKVLPAIATGCTVVLKPSELAPLSCLLLGEICTQAGLPDGVLNVLYLVLVQVLVQHYLVIQV